MKNMLRWNEFESGFECMECNGIYSTEELGRVFEYNGVRKDNFTPCHCMDCGTLWTKVEMEDFCE